MALSGAELLEYACMKFQQEKYDEALEAFVLAYSKGYEQEFIIENIYSCYMGGNEEIFKETYDCLPIGRGVSYEDCLLDFVPYKDGEYYVFDKEIEAFRAIFSIHEIETAQRYSELEKMEYSAIALEMDWNWNEQKNVLAEAKERKLYVISHDVRRMFSFCKIPELEAYMKNVRIFSNRQEFQEYFHKNTSVYLPHAVLGKEEEKNALLEVMMQEHEYRCTPEGRNTDNVLLTIAIPTCNRGNLLLKRIENLCRMPYDAEVEFAVSKNGTDFYQEEYEKVGRMPDARIHYFDHGKYLKPVENWHYVVEMAHGKFVLMVSDEDDVIIEALEHYFKILHSYPEVNLMRAKTVFQYRMLGERKYGKKGLEAFDVMFLRQNYLSGLVLRREDFIRENLLELERFSDNPFYQNYPHEWWCAMMSRKGDYMEEPVELIFENESVLGEETRRFKEMGTWNEGDGILEGAELPSYSTYEARLEQFRGQLGFLRWFMQGNQEGLECGLGKAFDKTCYLLELAREYDYKEEEFEDFVDQFLWMCIEAVDEMPLEEEQRVKLLQWARDLGLILLEWNEELREERAVDNKQ